MYVPHWGRRAEAESDFLSGVLGKSLWHCAESSTSLGCEWRVNTCLGGNLATGHQIIAQEKCLCGCLWQNKLRSRPIRKSSRQTLLRPPTDSQPGCKPKASHYDLITHRETERKKNKKRRQEQKYWVNWSTED